MACPQATCQHCLACLPCALTYELCDRTRRQQPEPYIPWWPASIDSPTLYYQLKRRAQAHQFREQARSGFSDPSVWRCQSSSAAAGCGSQLLAARGARQLAVRLPTARTNIAAADELEFVGICNLQAPAVQQQQQQQAAVQHLQAASPMDVQQQQEQQQQQQTKVVARPRARRASPPLPPAAPAQQQQTAACPPLHAQHLDLLASLQYQEQCHRQQLAAALPAATAWAAPSYAAAHPASYLRPAPTSWQCVWDGMQQQQQQQQLQCQQAAAAAETAAWPFAVPAQQQGGWAFGASVALPPLQLSTTALAAC